MVPGAIWEKRHYCWVLHVLCEIKQEINFKQVPARKSGALARISPGFAQTLAFGFFFFFFFFFFWAA